MFPGTQQASFYPPIRRSLLDIARWVCGRRIRFLVTGDSMHPTLKHDHSVLVDTTSSPSVGNIVVLYHPQNAKMVLIKRCMNITEKDLWVEGDNPEHSTDSRHFGWVSRNSYIGRVSSFL